LDALARHPAPLTPFLEGRACLPRRGPELNRREISKYSARGAERLPSYEAMLDRVAAFVEPTITATPPNVLRPGVRDLWSLLTLGRSFSRLGSAASDAVEILTGSARTLLDRWFESDQLKATLA